MVGLVGRSSILLDCRLGQYSKRCCVVSAGLSQWRQCGWCSGLILLRCWFVLVHSRCKSFIFRVIEF